MKLSSDDRHQAGLVTNDNWPMYRYFLLILVLNSKLVTQIVILILPVKAEIVKRSFIVRLQEDLHLGFVCKKCKSTAEAIFEGREEKSRVCYMEVNGIRTCERCRGSFSGVDRRPNDEILCTVCRIDSLSSRQDNTCNQLLAGSEDQPKTANIGEAEPEKANTEPTRSN